MLPIADMFNSCLGLVCFLVTVVVCFALEQNIHMGAWGLEVCAVGLLVCVCVCVCV